MTVVETERRFTEALSEPGSVFLDDRESGRCYLLSKPKEIVRAATPEEVAPALERLGHALRDGAFAAGYVSFEAGLALVRPCAIRSAHSLPLVWLGLYETARAVSPPAAIETAADDLRNCYLNVSEEEYAAAVRRIGEYIAAGDVYQVNYTCKLRFEHAGSAADLFSRLRSAHPVGYSAYLQLGDAQIVSMSPEMLLRRNGRHILSRPMKGTARRGRWVQEDLCAAAWLANDEKNRAENLMILDLMRNDFGRVCQYGTVRVPTMFRVERYPTVWQMTSEVEGLLREDTGILELLCALLPPGSVTGTPKLRACEIIGELEAEARGPYCGTIGMFRPNGDCLLNVAIRTIVQQGKICELGIGGAVVADSTAPAERQEAIAKSRFLFAERRQFDLLETLRYDLGRGYLWLEEHLARMQASAKYFGRHFEPESARAALFEAGRPLEKEIAELGASSARVRLTVPESGEPKVEWSILVGGNPASVALCLARYRSDPENVFLYHKTTYRKEYDEELSRAQAAGYFEALFLNLRGELTECSRFNLVALFEGTWVTPSLGCGLLPGLWREHLLSRGILKERPLTLADLLRAQQVVIGNSVRGVLPVSSLDLGNGRFLRWPTSPSSLLHLPQAEEATLGDR